VAQVDIWMSAPNIRLLGETTMHWEDLKELAIKDQISGPRIRGASIAVMCL
jgi:hypothetical protein